MCELQMDLESIVGLMTGCIVGLMTGYTYYKSCL